MIESLIDFNPSFPFVPRVDFIVLHRQLVLHLKLRVIGMEAPPPQIKKNKPEDKKIRAGGAGNFGDEPVGSGPRRRGLFVYVALADGRQFGGAADRHLGRHFRTRIALLVRYGISCYFCACFHPPTTHFLPPILFFKESIIMIECIGTVILPTRTDL